jgi:TP901 family phage tail tape measure protein
MALERIGIGGVLKFDANRAIGNMKRAGVSFGKLNKRAATLGRGVNRLGTAVPAGAAAFAGMSATIGAAFGSAAKFEQQMSVVNSVLDDTNKKFLPQLTTLAKEMGASTSFSATRAGQGIEAMGRAGASASDIMDGLGGVLNAAAAEGIDLGRTSEIVSDIINGMGLTFKDATRVADVLAFTSKSVSTKISLLGGSFKDAAAQARGMGLSLETTAAALGAISDTGLKGTRTGRTFARMLQKLEKPSKKAAAFMEEYNIQLTGADGKMKDIFEITKLFDTALKKTKDELKRSGLATEIFGTIGKKAFGAIALSLKKVGPKNVLRLRENLEKAKGTAAEMASVRLDNLIGSITLFGSALEGLNIEVFSSFLPLLKKGFQGITTAIQGVVKGLIALSKPGRKGREEFDKLGETTQAVVLGLRDGIEFISDSWKTFLSLIKSVGAFIKSGLGSEGVRAFTKFAFVIGVAAVAMSPLLLALGAAVVIISSVLIPAISGLGAIISAVGVPILAIAAAGIVGWQLFGKQIATFVTGLKSGLMPSLEALGVIWTALLDEVMVSFSSVVSAWNGGTKRMSRDYSEFGKAVGSTLVFILKRVLKVMGFLVTAFSKMMIFVLSVGNAIWTGLNAPLKFAIDLILNLQDAWTELVNGNILKGIAKIGLAIVDSILTPFRILVRMAVKFGKSIGFNIPESLSRFAEQGFSGLAFGRDDVGAVPGARTPASAPNLLPAASPAAQAAIASAKGKKDSDKGMLDAFLASMRNAEKQKIEINNNLSIDGRETAIATQRHKVELQERAGFKATPWQRRMSIEAGGVPVASGG